MTPSQTLGEWIRDAFGDQGGLADALKPKVAKNTVSSWKTGRNGVPPDYEKQLRKLGFKGKLPQEMPKGTPAGLDGSFVTREEYEGLQKELWKTIGRLETLERAFEKLGEGVRELALQAAERSSPRGRG